MVGTNVNIIPQGWELKRLKDVFNINELSLPSNTSKEYLFRYIPIEHVETNHIAFENCELFRFDEAPGRARRVLREDDILISGVRPNLKSFAIFKAPNGNENWICSTGFYVLTAKKEEDNLISYYELLSDIGEGQFYSYVAGTNYPAIGDHDIRNLYLILPISQKEKTAIANILSKVDTAITAVQNSIDSAERLKKGLMQNLLTGKMKPDGTFRTPEEFYIDEKFGKVPVGWECDKFKEFAVLQRGNDLTDSDVIPGSYPVVKSNGVSIWHNQFFIEPPGVVTGRSGTIGKAFYIEERFWAHNTTLYVKDFKGNVPKYIYYLILSMDFSRYYAGTTVPTLNRNDIHKLKVIIPSETNVQQQIVDRIDAAISIIQEKQQKIATLERLKKSLMQNLLTGKVRIS